MTHPDPELIAAADHMTEAADSLASTLIFVQGTDYEEPVYSLYLLTVQMMEELADACAKTLEAA